MFISVITAASAEPASYRLLSVKDYEDKVYAGFLGQMVGNLYGLAYEFKFIDEPGPDAMPYGFSKDILRQLVDLNGGFSDDDTDIEYMYLLQMERHGIEPTYKQLAEAWKYHVRERIWVANRVAVAQMNAGLYPPHTGMKEFNDQWFQIDPQIENEIWAVTAPGMVDYATAKSEWAARITSDGFGVEPTVFYAAMYSSAFFEKDVGRLVECGLKALRPESRFAIAVRYVQQLVATHPKDWRAARKALAARYHGEFDYNRGAWPVVDANLNGACAIMALLYGQGDFQRTLDMACAIGFDTDCNAATMLGLLGIVKGTNSIPRELLFPLKGVDWQLPFNDRYVNITRYDLPDGRITDLARRLAHQGERIVLAHGGERVTIDNREYYRIPSGARFTPPFELNSPPVLRSALGETLQFEFYTGRSAKSVKWVIEGELPKGLTFDAGLFTGAPYEVGFCRLIVRVSDGNETRSAAVAVQIRGRNLALAAEQILFNPDCQDHDLSLLRDEDRRERTYFSVSEHSRPKVDFYGYRWSKPQRISALRYSVGKLREWGGWFTTLGVEALSANGEWVPVSNLRIDPKPNLENNQWLKASRIDYDLAFDPVETTAIRIIGSAGGIEPDAANRQLGTHYYTAISELAVYER